MRTVSKKRQPRGGRNAQRRPRRPVDSPLRAFRRSSRRFVKRSYPRLLRLAGDLPWRPGAGLVLLLGSGLALLSVLSSQETPGNPTRSPGEAGSFLGSLVAAPLLANLGPLGAFALLLALLALGIGLLAGPESLLDLLASSPRSRPKRSRPRGPRAVRSAPHPVLPGIEPPPAAPSVAEPAAATPAEPEGAPAVTPTPTPSPAPKGESHKSLRWPAPSVDLLDASASTGSAPVDLEQRTRVIDETFRSFGIEARVVNVRHGPAVTRFGVNPAPGVKVARILALSNDIALRLAASPLRMEAPVPGESVVGIEVPNGTTEMVSLRGLMEGPAYASGGNRLKLALGRDVSGKPVVAELGKMPHLLIAGATGSGKSVCINTILVALLLQYSPDELQLMLIDPKKVEMQPYEGVPHLLTPVITDMERVVPSLRWVVKEMERRYRLFADKGFRNLEGYNKACSQKQVGLPLPFIAVIVDELADLMMTAGDDVEPILCRLAQLARATGIHLVIATQRPSVDVVTGLIKANFPTRIAFAVTSQVDSRTILDQAGAEKLVGRGDSLYLPPESSKPLRVQGAYTSDAEIRAVVEFWKKAGPQWGEVRYAGAAPFQPIEDDQADELYQDAEDLAMEHDGKVSISFLQRKLRIGSTRAKRLKEALERNGVLQSSEPREGDPDL